MTYLDTNILVYLLEDCGESSMLVAAALSDLQAQGQRFAVSTIAITEFFARSDSPDLAQLQAVPQLSFVPVSPEIALQAAEIRNAEGLKLGDAIHLATAVAGGAQSLFTNDQQLAGVAANYLDVLTVAA